MMHLPLPARTFVRRRALLALLAVLLTLAAPGRARGQEAPAAPVLSPLEQRLVRVVAPQATAMAVRDDLGLLFVAQRGSTALSVYRLDPKGQLQGDAVKVELPRDPALAAFANYPLSLALHPTLPLLYVWQDLDVPAKQAAAHRPAVTSSFDHLLIYNIAADGALTLAGAFGRGAWFGFGFDVGDIALTPLGKRIYLPNLCDMSPKNNGIGYFDLDEKGLPAPMPVAIAGSLDGFGLDKFEMKIQPRVLDLTGQIEPPSGLGFYAPTEQMCFIMIGQGTAAWDTENRLAHLAFISVLSSSLRNRLGGSPAVSAVFGAGVDTYQLWRIEHAEGYPTMMPQLFNYSGAEFSSAPLVVPGQPNLVVVGSKESLYAIPLDARGQLTPAHQRVAVANPKVTALAWSKRFDRIYLPVAKAEGP